MIRTSVEGCGPATVVLWVVFRLSRILRLTAHNFVILGLVPLLSGLDS